MNKTRAGLAIIMVTVMASVVWSQCKARVEFSSDGKRPTAVYDLMADYPTYDNKQFIGKIVHVQYDQSTGAEIVGFALERSNGIRKSVDITHDDCVSKMIGVERSWLPYIIRKGYRVRVEAEISGSGGFVNARNIILLNQPPRTPKRRRR